MLCLVLALAGQAMADSLVPEASGVETGRAVGRAASSYLSGLRTFAASVLWNRIDPVFHGYYHNLPLSEQRFVLSTIAIVQSLDPHMVQSYYIGPWILRGNDRLEDAIAMSERGVEANPKAGILLMNLAQMRMLYQDDLSGAVEVAERALAPDVEWTDFVEQHNAYPILGAVFRAAGRDDLDAIVQAELIRLDAEAGDLLDEEDHDHDHDGVPDH
ncbi:MAG: hypothetical protein JXP72_06905 [Coriobacteriia bacterium]|nr:hypothetical protein [Coriobacteriia bacterium]